MVKAVSTSIKKGTREVSQNDILLHSKEKRWSFPEDLPDPDFCLNDNVLVSLFPKLSSCGSMVHAKSASTVEGDDVIALGIDCCGVCAKRHDERFRCKKCHGVVYCSVAHQAVDRGFHATVCEALQVVDADRANDDVQENLTKFVTSISPCSLPVFTEALADLSLEEVFYEFVFDKAQSSEWKCVHFLHGTPLGRTFMDHATFPLTLWSQWDRLPARENVVHVIGASRSECQYPALWSLLLPKGSSDKRIHEISFFGPHVPKSLHFTTVHGTLKFFRMKYHNAIEQTAQNSPTVVFAPAMGITSGHYGWDETLTAMETFLKPGTIVITTCYSEEEMYREVTFLLQRFRWKQICQPFLNPFASTRIQQNTNLANDVYRSNYMVCIFQVA